MFRDSKKQKEFKKKGFVSFHLLNTTEIKEALTIFSRFEKDHHQSFEKFRGTGWVNDGKTIIAISQVLKPLISPALELNFCDYKSLGFGFLLKEPGQDSGVPLHQDWTYVDETRFCSMNVWIALEDMQIANGCLHFIPGSHLLANNLRPSPTYPVPFKDIVGFIQKFKKPVEIKAGDCICFNHKTLHGSYPNLGNTIRLAVVTTLYPAQAQLLHHYVHKPQQPESITEYEIDEEAFLILKRGLPPGFYKNTNAVLTAYPDVSKWQFVIAWIKSFF